MSENFTVQLQSADLAGLARMVVEVLEKVGVETREGRVRFDELVAEIERRREAAEGGGGGVSGDAEGPGRAQGGGGGEAD